MRVRREEQLANLVRDGDAQQVADLEALALRHVLDALDQHVQAFPAGSEQLRVSTAGGWAPRWRGDGAELFFLALDGMMMAASIHGDNGSLRPGDPKPLFRSRLTIGETRHDYAVTKDGNRFLLRVPDPLSPPPTSFTVVLNWLSTFSGVTAPQ